MNDSVRAATAAEDPALAAEAFALRHEVFVVEQGVPVDLERDGDDEQALHLLLLDGAGPVGAARLVVERPGYQGLPPRAGPVAHLGRLAVVATHRGRGLGVRLVRAVEAAASERNLRLVYLGAQTHAVAFYERLGYASYGDEFDDAGLPHRHMARRLDRS